MQLTGHVACMGGFRNCIYCRLEKLNGTDHCSQLNIRDSLRGLDKDGIYKHQLTSHVSVMLLLD